MDEIETLAMHLAESAENDENVEGQILVDKRVLVALFDAIGVDHEVEQ